MMNSRSIASRNSGALRRWVASAVAVLALVVVASTAHAGKRRIVVLDFDGPKGDQFQEQVEAVLKKAATLVAAEKWADAADDLGVRKMTAKGVAKIAAKLRVDGVVVGNVDRRGSRYFVHVRLREGKSGEFVSEVELVVRSGKLSSSDQAEVKDQIAGGIATLPAPGSDDDDEDADDDRRAKPKDKGKGKDKGKHRDDDEDDDRRARAKDRDDDDEDDDRRAKGRGFGGRDRDDDDERGGDRVADRGKGKDKGKAKDKAKDKDKDKDRDDEDDDRGEDDRGDDDRGDDDRVATRNDDEDDAARDDDGDLHAGGSVAGDPRHRPLEALAGLSFTARRLSFRTEPTLTNKPQGYKGAPVAGAYVDATFYPLAFNRKNKSILRDLGLEVMLDRVIKIESKLAYKDGAGMNQTATLGTTEQHLALGLTFRYALGKGATGPMLIGSVRYNRLKFVIDKAAVPTGAPTPDIPNTDYTYVDPGLAITYPASPTLRVGGGARVLVITDTGEMQNVDQYGAATVLGFDVDLGVDYTLTRNWFVHAGVRLHTIGFTFKGNGALTNNRDGDMTTVDVHNARDNYFGGAITAGYAY